VTTRDRKRVITRHTQTKSNWRKKFNYKKIC